MTKLTIRSGFRRPVQPKWPDQVFSYMISALGLCVFGAVLLLGTGCGGPEADPDPFGDVLSPTTELYDTTVVAARRWEVAGGLTIPVRLGTRGVSIAMTDHIFEMPDGTAAFEDPDGVGEERGGVNDSTGIWISRAMVEDLLMSLTHEIGHWLGAKHTATGVMWRKGGSRIDDASLTSACDVAPCTVFRPE